MYDENGSNLSEQLFQKELYTPAGQEMWKKMASAHWLQDGRKDAPIVLYVFADPFCPYCKQFWQQSRPWVEAGKVQIRTLLVGVIKPESPATAAAILASNENGSDDPESYSAGENENAQRQPAADGRSGSQRDAGDLLYE